MRDKENTEMSTEIKLISRHYDGESKCCRCGYRCVQLWNLGENESEELAACGDCTMEIIADSEQYTLSKHTPVKAETQDLEAYTKPVAELSAGEALQRLYSYTESTGAEVGALVQDLKDEEVNTGKFVTALDEDGERYQSPPGYPETHFTDVVGKARQAADTGNLTKATEMIEETILPILKGTRDTIREIQDDVGKLPMLSEDTMSELEYVKNSYEHMVKVAEHAENTLKKP